MREKLFEINKKIRFEHFFSDVRYRFDDWLLAAKREGLITESEKRELYQFCMEDPVEKRRTLEKDLMIATSVDNKTSEFSDAEREIIRGIREGKLQVVKVITEESY